MQSMPRQPGYTETVLICALLALPLEAHADGKIDANSIFDEWSVFIDSDDCWIASHPRDKQQDIIEDITVFVAFHQRSMISEISLLFEGGPVDLSNVEIILAGKTYSLTVYEDTAFTAASENLLILKHMLSAKPTSVSYATSTAAVTGLTIGYEGFRDAYNFTSKNCEFYKSHDLDDNANKEPV